MRKKIRTAFRSLIDRFRLIEDNPDFIDKKSFAYYQKLSELATYKKKLREINAEIVKNLLSSPSKYKKLLLKRQVAIRNIRLLRRRLTKRSFSYTKLLRGLRYYESLFFEFLGDIGNIFLYALFVFSLYYVAVRGLAAVVPESFSGIYPQTYYLLTLSAATGIALRMAMNWWALILSTGAYAVFFLFLQVNF